MNHAVLGLGEVGKAHLELLSRKFEVWGKDVEDKPLPDFKVDVLHVALNFHALGRTRFLSIVAEWCQKLNPSILSILSTVEPGVTEAFGTTACHSTTRGLHPGLVTGLEKVAKHVGGPMAETLARQFASVGIRCVTHTRATTTELLHILNNSHYGVNLMFADEAARLCRDYGVDFFEYLKYTETHNRGFEALDHPRLVRPVLMPPGGRIGGHCVQQGATLVPEELRGPMLRRLATYNDPPTPKCAHGWDAAPKEFKGIDCPSCYPAAASGCVLPLDAERDRQGGGSK